MMLLVLNLPMAKVWARLLTIPAYGIYAGVLVFATLGTFATGGTTFDLLILCALGLLGLLMMQGGIPVAPAIVGLILGPIAEEQLRRALTLSEGDPSILVSSPITIVLWAVVVIAVVASIVLPRARRRRMLLKERAETQSGHPVGVSYTPARDQWMLATLLRPQLLPRHRDAEAFVGVDVVVGVLGVLAQVDLHPVDRAAEPAGVSGVVGADRGAGLPSDVRGLVGGEDDTLG